MSNLTLADCFRADSTMDVAKYYEYFRANRLDACPLVERNSKLEKWFDDPDTFHEPEEYVYPKPEGCMDPLLLAKIFYAMESNMIRVALIRSQPGYNKNAGKRITKLIVGNLQLNQWNYYKTLKSNALGSHIPKFTTRKTSKPGLGRRISERFESMKWDTSEKNKQKLPLIAYKEDWYFNKWLAGGSVWRSWLQTFVITWDSYYGNVYISFDYVTQHFDTVDRIWTDN